MKTPFRNRSVVYWDAIKDGYCWCLSLVGAEERIPLEQQTNVVIHDVVRNADLTEELQVLQVLQERLKNKHVFESHKRKQSNWFDMRVNKWGQSYNFELVEFFKPLSHLNGAEEAQVVQRDEAQEDGYVVGEPGGGVEIGARGVITSRSWRWEHMTNTAHRQIFIINRQQNQSCNPSAVTHRCSGRPGWCCRRLSEWTLLHWSYI